LEGLQQIIKIDMQTGPQVMHNEWEAKNIS
jgi:predicted RNase H-like HicB family nuclease